MSALLLACDVHTPSGPGSLVSITVTPDVELPINATQQFSAVGEDAAGVKVSISPVWSVVAGGGTITRGGLFTAGTVPGVYVATVRAASEGMSGTASVTVVAGPLATITISPDPDSLSVGSTQRFTAVGTDAGGNVVPVAPGWSVAAGGGSISLSGLFTAGTVAGTFTNTIVATSGSITGTATVTVLPGALTALSVSPNPVSLAIGAKQQFTAVGTDASGNIVALTPTWSVVANGGTITGAGLFTAGTVAGAFANTVKATSGSISGTATVTVLAGALTTITVAPNPVTLAIGGTQQFTAVGTDASGNVVAITPAWSMVAGGGAISGTGLFTAGTVAGTFANTITATSGSISGAATVTVSPGALTTIAVSPNPISLAIGGAQQYTAVGTDASGNAVAITPSWSVVANGGTINGAGLFTAGTVAGTFANTIVATSGAITGTATVTVLAGALTTLTVSPNPVTLAIGAKQQFTAAGTDASGNVVAITPTWSVVASGGTINGSGLFTAGTVAGPFANTIVATSGAITGTATVTVLAGALATIAIAPNPVTLAIGAKQQFTAAGTDASGNAVAITPVWSTVASGGTINASGLLTAGTVAGTFGNTVHATSGGISGTATVTVLAGALTTITVTPTPVTLAIGATQQFIAVGTDASGNVLAITPTWSVVANGGTITGAGLFTAGTVAGAFANTVKATSGSVSGTATVTVLAGALTTITVAPNPVTLAIGATQQFTAVGTDASGNVLAMTPSWSLVAGGGAISGTGLFTAGTVAGTFANTVVATSGAITGTATVTVLAGALTTITVAPNPVTLAIGAKQQFTAVGTDASGNAVGITPTWSVAAGGGATSGTGLFTAGTVAGTFANTVVATSGAITGTATVTVLAGALTTITVTPTPVTLAIGAKQQFTAVGTDASGNTVTTAPTWSVVANGGTITGAGLFTAGTVAGTFTNTIEATSGAISGTATATVLAGALTTITISPNPLSLAIGRLQQFSAVGTDASGNVVAITPSWSVAAGGGTISGVGLFTAGTVAGTFANTIVAASGAITGTATVTVQAGALTTITVTPTPVTLAIGATQQFTAVGTDAGGNTVAITPSWSVAAGGGAISGTGLFTAGTVAGAFANTIEATSGGISGTATVTVLAGALTTIAVTPNPVTLAIAGTQQFSAVGHDASGNVVAITPTWSVVANGGTISASGQFTAGTVAGTFANTIEATSGAISGTATVTVLAGALTTVTVTPSPVTLAIGATQQFTAVGTDASGNIVAITPTWSVIANGGAITGAGLFTAGTLSGVFANTVQASSGAVSGTATVTVLAGALTTIAVTPNPVTLAIAGTQQFSAVGHDASGNVVAIAPTWSVVANGGTISASGLFTAGTVAGTFANTIEATSGAISGTATVTVLAGALTAITVTPNPVTLAIGGAQQFSAVGNDASGNPVAITPTWSVSSGGGGISASGLFTAGTVAGTFANTIVATSGAITGTATVTVLVGALTTVTVTPNPVTLPIGGTQQFSAVGHDASGNVVAITPSWSVAAGGGAISGSGLFTAGTVAGTFASTVVATSGAITGTATVTVLAGALTTVTVTPDPVTLAVAGTQQFSAVGHDASGNVVAIAPSWSVVAGGGTISASGLFTAGTVAGAFANTIEATSGGISGTATVTVLAGALTAITVTPNPVTLAIGGAQQFSAVGHDASGNVVAITPSWSAVAGGGTISASGLFTAGTVAGTFANTVEATSGSISGTATVTVLAGALTAITVTPNPVTLAIGGAQQFMAVGHDASGNTVAITPTWSVVANGGTISASGLFTAGTVAGTFANTVEATSGSVSGAATVTVSAGALTSIAVSPDPVTLAIGGVQQFSAVGTDASGNIVAITPAWSVAAGGGTISASGLFTAGTVAGTFANTVEATSSSVSGTATVSIVAGALTAITVTPNPVTLAIGGAQQFTAVGHDASGNVVAITPSWSVAAGGGTISASGLFTAGTLAGTFANTVEATSGSVSDAATVTVSPGALTTITVSPNPVSLAIGANQQFTAVGTDASGNIVAIAPAWSVATGGGTISASGLFTAGTVAGTFANTIEATSGSISGTATVTVLAGALATITVSPAAVSLTSGSTQQFTAAGADASGNPVAIAPGWSVAAGGGTISSGGLFTAGGAAGTFTNTIEANSGAVSGFASVTVTVPPPLVDLGNLETHGVFAATTVTCVSLTAVTGDIGVAPGTAITGFPPCVINGVLHANDGYAQAAHATLITAFAQLSAMPCDTTLTTDLGGHTFRPRVYCAIAAATLTGEVILDAQGDPNASFVIKAGTTITTAALSQVTLLNGAQAKNVYWLVGSSATIGAGSALKGNIIVFTSVTMGSDVNLIGRVLARNAAITLDTNDIITLP